MINNKMEGCNMKIKGLNNNLKAFFEYNEHECIGSHVVFLYDIHNLPLWDYHFKPGVIMCMFCNSGYVEANINTKKWKFGKNSLHIVQPTQTVQYISVSEDFSASLFFLSIPFINNLGLNAKESSNIFLNLMENPVLMMNCTEERFLDNYYAQIRMIAKMDKNPYQIEIAKHSFLMFFYATCDLENYSEKITTLSRTDSYFETFHNTLVKYYRESREVSFYADKLCLNSKYLSTIIKEKTGKSVSEWIDYYVISEAKALLKGNGTTVQEVSNDLGFPDQSSFGKYFKRHVGLSPKEYKQGVKIEILPKQQLYATHAAFVS